MLATLIEDFKVTIAQASDMRDCDDAVFKVTGHLKNHQPLCKMLVKDFVN